MSYEAYKILHVVGVLGLFAALGGLTALQAAAARDGSPAARLFGILHGVALALILVAGFGILARLGLKSPASWPLWVWIKVGVWLVLGAALGALRRAGTRAGPLVLVWVLLGGVAAWSAIVKP
jgi:hypothetical protein